MNTPAVAERILYKFKLRLGSEELEARARVPDCDLRVTDLLPILQSFSDAISESLARQIAAQGKTISCRAGCGACCRQPVPLSRPEAVQIAELVAAMPQARQVTVRARFAQGVEALARCGLLEPFRAIDDLDDPEGKSRLCHRYFEQGIACPFLEDESCSIYLDRPLICREYLVTSPPEWCATLAKPPEKVPVPASLARVLFRFGDGVGEDGARSVPLLLALDWAGRDREAARRTFPARRLFENLLSQFTHAQGGPPPAPSSPPPRTQPEPQGSGAPVVVGAVSGEERPGAGRRAYPVRISPLPVPRSCPTSAPAEVAQVRYSFCLRLGGEFLEAEASVPDVDLRVADLLPVLQSLDDAIVASLARQVEAQGRPISCRAGCGACCCQVVPVSEPEAVHVAEVVAAMPEERQAVVRARFDEGIERFERAGLLEPLRTVTEIEDRAERRRVACECFHLGVHCPFLEDGSCSIYPHRPLVCREYLVTSPPAWCGELNHDIVRVRVPVSLCRLLFHFGDGADRGKARLVPMLLALRRAEQGPGAAYQTFPARRLFESILSRLTDTDLRSDESWDPL